MTTTPVFWGVSETGWTAITGLATAVTGAVAIVAAIVALTQLRTSIGTWREESRAYVIAYFDRSPVAETLIDFVVRNTGRTPAFKIEIEWDPMPVEADPIQQFRFEDVRMFHEPMAMLPPGAEHRIFFDSTLERVGREDLVNTFTVTVTYVDHRQDRHVESYVLDFNARKGTRTVGIKTVHDMIKGIETIATALDKSPTLKGPVEVQTEARSEARERVIAEREEIMHRVRGLPRRRKPQPKRR